MVTLIIEPRDPLMVRDSKPFGLTPGSRARSLPFPFPSTIIGGLRARIGLNQGVFDTTNIEKVKKAGMRGPLLVELGQTEVNFFVPAPSDALIFESEDGKLDVHKIVPIETPEHMSTDLDSRFALTGLIKPNRSKVAERVPRFWNWKAFEKWLSEETSYLRFSFEDLGIEGLLQEIRTHVRIEKASQTALDGGLFQTSGLEFQTRKRKRLALAIDTDQEVDAGFAPLAGERRLVYWDKCSESFPTISENIKTSIAAKRACRLILLTPGFFQKGAIPSKILTNANEVKISLEAITLRNVDTVSGWNLEGRTPKPIRRLAAAGTTFFLKLEGEQRAIYNWIDNTWMRNVSDDEQSCLDGFGLAALGVWSGERKNMELE